MSGETKVVMEYTGTYYEPIANILHNAGIFVSVVNPLLINDYDTNRVRKVKTDRKDALKIASFALDKWMKFREYAPADDNEMDSLASQLPEYDTVTNLYGVGKVLCSQLIAEIGDIMKVNSGKSLVAL